MFLQKKYITVISIIATLFILSHADNPILPEEEDVKLTKPLCNIDITDVNEKKKFDDFAVAEECKFQLFMDKLEEIECLKTKAFESKCDEDQECEDYIIQRRDKIYEFRNTYNLTCPCKNMYEAEESPSEFENFDVRSKDEGRIETLEEYINCWDKGWDTMLVVVYSHTSPVTSGEVDDEVKRKCNLFSNRHYGRCKKYLPEKLQ